MIAKGNQLARQKEAEDREDELNNKVEAASEVASLKPPGLDYPKEMFVIKREGVRQYKILQQKVAHAGAKLRLELASHQEANFKSFGKTTKMVMALSKDLEVIKQAIKSTNELQDSQHLETTKKIKRGDDKMYQVQDDIDRKFREAVEKAEGSKQAIADGRRFAHKLDEKIRDLAQA